MCSNQDCQGHKPEDEDDEKQLAALRHAASKDLVDQLHKVCENYLDAYRDEDQRKHPIVPTIAALWLAVSYIRSAPAQLRKGLILDFLHNCSESAKLTIINDDGTETEIVAEDVAEERLH